MAMSATISVNPSTVVTGQLVNAILTLTNTATNFVNVIAVIPNALPVSGGVGDYNSGVALGVVNVMGPNVSLAVPGSSGTLTITFPINFHAPSTGYLSSGTATWQVGALIYTSDGSVFSPTAAAVTVNYAVSYATSQS